VSHFTTGTVDVARLKQLYERMLSAQTLHEDTGRAFLRVGTESVVELAQPASADSSLGRDLKANGELPIPSPFGCSTWRRRSGTQHQSA
jgi:hypothetical protein